MALITVIAGRYSATYSPGGGSASGTGNGPINVGITTDPGYELGWTHHEQLVNGTDAYGMSILETIFQGADFRLRFQCREYGTANMDIAWPWGRSGGQNTLIMGVVGRRGTDVAGAIVLTSTAGTPAATNPATLTSSTTIVSPQANFGIGFTTKVREVPIELLLLPYASSGNNVWFTVT